MRHLLTHTSGIDGDVFTDTGRGDDCLEKYVELLADVAQNHPLGATWSYCNSGFSLLGRVIEKLTGETWDEAMRERLFTPLGLTAHDHAARGGAPAPAPPSATSSRRASRSPRPVWELPRSLGPAGLITATVADVLGFARMHLTGGLAADGTRVLSEASAAAMAEHQADLPDKFILGDSWGLGWIRFGWDGHRLIGHDGNTIGQAAFLRILPEAGARGHAAHQRRQHPRPLRGPLPRDLRRARRRRDARPPSRRRRSRSTSTSRRTSAPTSGPSVRMEVLVGDDGPRLRTTIIGPLAEMVPDPVEEYPLVPVGPALFAVRPPEADTWAPVTFYELPTGERYVHFGVRATPRVD